MSSFSCLLSFSFFFFNDTATTEIYTLSLHDALPISSARPRAASACSSRCSCASDCCWHCRGSSVSPRRCSRSPARSEEHTSELQSQSNLVCRLLLEKKKKKQKKKKEREKKNSNKENE